MSTLNDTARQQLALAGYTPRRWSLANGGGHWGGDACGCTDDRCIGYHHDSADDCMCLPVLIELAQREGRTGRTAPPTR